MSSKVDANFSTPSHVGKIAGLQLNDLDKKDQTWILLAALSYTQPITLQRMEPPPEGDGDDNAADDDGGDEKPSRVRVRRSIQVLTQSLDCVLEDVDFDTSTAMAVAEHPIRQHGTAE